MLNRRKGEKHKWNQLEVCILLCLFLAHLRDEVDSISRIGAAAVCRYTSFIIVLRKSSHFDKIS